MKKPRKQRPAPKKEAEQDIREMARRGKARAKGKKPAHKPKMVVLDESAPFTAEDADAFGQVAPVRTRREIVEAVCLHVVAGDRVHLACSKEGIVWNQLWEWKLQDPELQALYARAREASAESWEDKATDHVETATMATVQLAHLREGNAKWRAKMANPRAFGEKVDVTSGGESFPALIAASMKITTEAP